MPIKCQEGLNFIRSARFQFTPQIRTQSFQEILRRVGYGAARCHLRLYEKASAVKETWTSLKAEETWTSFALGSSYELESLSLEPVLVDRYEGLRGINVSFVRLLEVFLRPVSCLWMSIAHPAELLCVVADDDVRTSTCFSELQHAFVLLDCSRKACSFEISARMCTGTRECALSFSSFKFMLMIFVRNLVHCNL